MKQKSICILMYALFLLAPQAQAANEITINLPFAFQDKFQEDVQQLGFPEGKVFQVGCVIKEPDSPIKQVTAKNLDTGLILPLSHQKTGDAWSGLYLAYPFPKFDVKTHSGEWEISAIDENENQTSIKTHKLNINAEMPFIVGIKAAGNPIAPLISWSPPDNTDVHEDFFVRYAVRLLTGMRNQLHRSAFIPETSYQVPEDLIKSKDLAKVYIRIDTYGYDNTDKEHPVPVESSSRTIISLQEALGKN